MSSETGRESPFDVAITKTSVTEIWAYEDKFITNQAVVFWL